MSRSATSTPEPSTIGLYVLADTTWGDPWPMAKLCADEGVATIQLRCKGWSSAEISSLAVRCARLGPRIVLNDHPEVARALGLDAHLGQDDGVDPVGVRFGRSTHTLAHVASPGAAWYLGFGPIFPSRTKTPAWSPRGVALLAEAVRQSAIPVVAIGGITAENVGEVVGTGVAGWAVAGAIWGASDPRAALRALQAAGR